MKGRWTMTLGLPKTGLLPEKMGELIPADIGIPEGAYRCQRLNLSYKPFWRSLPNPPKLQTVTREN